MIGWDFEKYRQYVVETFSTSKTIHNKIFVIQTIPRLLEVSVYLYSKIGFAMERHGEKRK